MNKTFVFLLLILSFAIPDLNGQFDSFIQNNSTDDKIELASDSYQPTGYRIFKQAKVVKEKHPDFKFVLQAHPELTEPKFHYSKVSYRFLKKIYSHTHEIEYPLIV